MIANRKAAHELAAQAESEGMFDFPSIPAEPSWPRAVSMARYAYGEAMTRLREESPGKSGGEAFRNIKYAQQNATWRHCDYRGSLFLGCPSSNWLATDHVGRTSSLLSFSYRYGDCRLVVPRLAVACFPVVPGAKAEYQRYVERYGRHVAECHGDGWSVHGLHGRPPELFYVKYAPTYAGYEVGVSG